MLATEDRKVGIEVGSGLEGDITDAQAGEIIDRCMIPGLKESKWAVALNEAITCIDYKLAK